jgi:hypothetical protein
LHGHAAGGKKTDTIAYMTPKEADNLQTEERGQNSLSSKKKKSAALQSTLLALLFRTELTNQLNYRDREKLIRGTTAGEEKYTRRTQPCFTKKPD